MALRLFCLPAGLLRVQLQISPYTENVLLCAKTVSTDEVSKPEELVGPVEQRRDERHLEGRNKITTVTHTDRHSYFSQLDIYCILGIVYITNFAKTFRHVSFLENNAKSVNFRNSTLMICVHWPWHISNCCNLITFLFLQTWLILSRSSHIYIQN